MNDSPKFSIVIPTRNGLKYLPYTIETVLSQPSQDFELIISDNHSTDGTAAYLETITDPRFRYVKPETPLSMVLHFEFVITQTRGRWITILGDDDGLMPSFFERLDALAIDTLDVDAITFRRAYYTWDGCQELQGDSVLYYSYYPKKAYLNNNISIFLCLISLIDYMYLPQLYTTGLIKRSYVESIKAGAGGKFYYGDTPDASSAAILALSAPRHYRFEEPLFWTGTSPKSVGFSQESKLLKAKALEFESLNVKDGKVFDNVMASRLDPALADIFDLTIIFYKAVQLCPNAGRMWKSRVVYYLFLAGLMLKDAKFVPVIMTSYATGPQRLALRLARLAVVAVKREFRRRNYDLTGKRPEKEIYSRDRHEFPTIREGSIAVARLWQR